MNTSLEQERDHWKRETEEAQFVLEQFSAESDRLRAALKVIGEVACGEVQLDDTEDDTDCLAWIWRKVTAALEPQEESTCPDCAVTSPNVGDKYCPKHRTR